MRRFIKVLETTLTRLLFPYGVIVAAIIGCVLYFATALGFL